jgi:hypothetical protein
MVYNAVNAGGAGSAVNGCGHNRGFDFFMADFLQLRTMV